MLSIVIPEELTTDCIKDLDCQAPHAIVHPLFLHTTKKGTVKGFAMHPTLLGYVASECEISPHEFAALEFKIIERNKVEEDVPL